MHFFKYNFLVYQTTLKIVISGGKGCKRQLEAADVSCNKPRSLPINKIMIPVYLSLSNLPRRIQIS